MKEVKQYTEQEKESLEKELKKAISAVKEIMGTFIRDNFGEDMYDDAIKTFDREVFIDYNNKDNEVVAYYDGKNISVCSGTFEKQKGSPDFLHTIIHEYAHMLSKDVAKNTNRRSMSIEESMANVFGEYCINYYKSKNGKLPYDYGEKKTYRKDNKYTSLTGYVDDDAIQNTFLFVLKQRGKDIEAIRKYIFEGQDKYFELIENEFSPEIVDMLEKLGHQSYTNSICDYDGINREIINTIKDFPELNQYKKTGNKDRLLMWASWQREFELTGEIPEGLKEEKANLFSAWELDSVITMGSALKEDGINCLLYDIRVEGWDEAIGDIENEEDFNGNFEQGLYDRMITELYATKAIESIWNTKEYIYLTTDEFRQNITNLLPKRYISDDLRLDKIIMSSKGYKKRADLEDEIGDYKYMLKLYSTNFLRTLINRNFYNNKRDNLMMSGSVDRKKLVENGIVSYIQEYVKENNITESSLDELSNLHTQEFIDLLELEMERQLQSSSIKEDKSDNCVESSTIIKSWARIKLEQMMATMSEEEIMNAEYNTAPASYIPMSFIKQELQHLIEERTAKSGYDDVITGSKARVETVNKAIKNIEAQKNNSRTINIQSQGEKSVG